MSTTDSTDSQDSPHENRLAHETSPYLLQHAHNPVDWYPWGPEALARAKNEDRLILLSIGYSACHWCHVMERESFEDEAMAKVMNKHFVNIKVDREERPDLDEIYMAATLALNRGQGGWPMTVFLTPGLEPVFAGTYFPPRDRLGQPGFKTILESVAKAWRDNRDGLLAKGAEVTEHLREQKEATPPALAVGVDALRLALGQFGEDFDPEHGGFGPAPKFPMAEGLSLLLRLHRRFADPQALDMVTRTLTAMAHGGIYDQVGGGFARYSVDAEWLVPHFEKMLYDNALLASIYLEAHQATGGEEPFRRVATEVLDYVLREMTSPEGAFHSATDADSEGVEGKFFIWTPEEISDILEPDAAHAFCRFYDITDEGNWEGKSIPRIRRSVEVVAEELGMSPEKLRTMLEEARAKVYAARQERVAPGLDDKILTAWNGMMIHALAQGHDVLADVRYLEAATRAADFALTTLRRGDGGLYRTFRAGKAHLLGYLEDTAWLAEALVTLYETGGETRFLHAAGELAERLLADFADEERGGFWNTARNHEKLLLRYREGTDGATPSGNAVAASALARLGHHLDRDDFRDAAVGAIRVYGRVIERFPRAFARSLAVVDFLLEGPTELAFVGAPGDDANLAALRRSAAVHYLPNRIQAVGTPVAGDEPATDDVPPLLRGKSPIDGQAALYVCRDFACREPLTDPDAVAAMLGEAAETATASASTVITRRLAGGATAEGTARFAARFEKIRETGFTELGKTGLQASRLGFGAYRVADVVDTHREALKLALAAGVNLVDTSTNYTDGASERLVGGILRELVDAGELARDEVIVVSKIGYVQGRNYQLAREREAEGRPFPEMVKLEDGLWHCLHPDFLADQLGRSLDRLELDHLDLCLLHNPEYFLAEAARRGAPPAETKKELARRFEAAFAFFEEEVSKGRLGAYGVSSNTVARPDTPDGTSLESMLGAARAAGGEAHHFRVLQLPLNLFETEAALGEAPLLELARREAIAVLVNRPLNAFTTSGLRRLADVGEIAGELADRAEDLDVALGRLGELEKEFRETIAASVEGQRGAAANDAANNDSGLGDSFRWSDEIRALLPRLQGLEQGEQVAIQIIQVIERVASFLENQLQGELAQRWGAWRERYFPAVDAVLLALRVVLAERSRERGAAVAQAIDPLLAEERRAASLSQKALWIAASTPGVDVVLCGMRRADYVADATAILGWKLVENSAAVYRAVVGG